MTTLERCAAINEIALAIAWHRMGDTQHLLSPDMIVKDADRALAMEVIRKAAPINLEMHVRRIIDATWGYALEDGSVPSTDIQNKIIGRLNAHLTTTVKSQDVWEALATAQTEITRFRATAARQDTEEKARLTDILTRALAWADDFDISDAWTDDARAALACRPQREE